MRGLGIVQSHFLNGFPHPSALDEWSAGEDLFEDDEFESDIEIEAENLYVFDG